MILLDQRFVDVPLEHAFKKTPGALIGGWGCKTERSGGPHRESKPSAQRQRTARTTRQINGAIFV